MEKKKFKKRKIIIPVVIVIAIIAIIYAISGSNVAIDSSTYKGEQVQTYEKHDLSTSINVSGTIESQNVTDVTTELNCKVKELKVSLGDHVNVGDVLMVFDDSEIREQILEIETQISESDMLAAKELSIAERDLTYTENSINRKIASANDAVTKAQTAYDNNNKLYSNETDPIKKAEYKIALDASAAALSEAKDAYDEIKSSGEQTIQSAKDSIEIKNLTNSTNSELTKTLSKLYRQLDEINVTAAQSGIVTSLNIAQGGMPNGVLLRIEDNENLKIKVSINEKDIIKLSEGLNAAITSDALPDEEYKGTVSKVINFASAQTSLTDTAASGYSAEITLTEDSKFLLGMSAKVSIQIKNIGDKLSVSYDSIGSEDDNPFVYKAVPEGDNYKVVKVNVTVGEKNDYYTEISSPDLKEGDIVVSYPDSVSEGDTIIIHKN